MQENMKEYLTEKEAREKRLEVYTEKIQEKVLSRSSETIRQAVSGGETPPENDAAGNSGYYRDKTVEYGTVRERRQGTNTGCTGEICECTWKTY